MDITLWVQMQVLLELGNQVATWEGFEKRWRTTTTSVRGV